MSIDYVTGDDHVVTITINRPEARNSMDMEHFFQLRSAWERFGEDDDAYVAIITGVGKDFCVGADLKTYIPQITELQSRRCKAGEVSEDRRLPPGRRRQGRPARHEAVQADRRRRQRELRGRRHGDARRLRPAGGQ
jgi:enoyl-CoA hydratase/carnithine racemase